MTTPRFPLSRRLFSVPVLLAALAAVPVSLSNAQTNPAAGGAPGAGATRGGLPSLGDEQDMSIAAERRLGDRIARDIYRDPDYLDDPVLGDYLSAIWQPLLGAARARGDVPPELSERLAWELMISRDRRVNAFALPGGYLGVNLGLLAVTERPEELAAVMAHELSHVSQRHIARLVSSQDRLAPWMLGAMILGALAARANTEVANAAIVGSQAVAMQTQLNFSRDMEREADRVGFGVLTGAGFEGQGFVDMFDRLQQASRLNDDGSFPYLRSHPLTSERIADMRARLPLSTARAGPGVGPLKSAVPGAVANAPATGGPAGLRLDLPALSSATPPPSGLVTVDTTVSAERHALMAARARVLAENGPDRLRAWLQTGQGASASPGVRYAAALSAQRLGQRDLALDLAQRLRGSVAASARPAADALMLELLLTAPAAGGNSRVDPNGALLASLRDQALAGDSRAELLLGAQAALATGVPARAVSRLQAWVVHHPRDAMAWQVLARAHQAQGQTLRSIRAEAESRAAHMDYEGAADRFRAAQALPAAQRAADPMELAIVDSRRREVERMQRELALERNE
ncbi:M48 family metalloprotease [Hydrogenophaga sp.]|uniref:M48 family metalloprotease n=1 Tax=Hydrogenophaga sp. TaxID=1904254 RepID=UPI0034497EA7